jgi:hypothetical protein
MKTIYNWLSTKPVTPYQPYGDSMVTPTQRHSDLHRSPQNLHYVKQGHLKATPAT